MPCVGAHGALTVVSIIYIENADTCFFLRGEAFFREKKLPLSDSPL